MVDLETLGTSVNAPIIQLSAVCFNLENDDIQLFERFIDLNDNFNVDKDTLKWWLDTNAGLLEHILNHDSRRNEKLALLDFESWITSLSNDNSLNDIFLIGNGILFDNNIIRHHMEFYDIRYPINYSNDIDFRTLILLGTIKLESAMGYQLTPWNFKDAIHDFIGTKHDAMDDTLNQIEMFKKTLRYLVADEKGWE